MLDHGRRLRHRPRAIPSEPVPAHRRGSGHRDRQWRARPRRARALGARTGAPARRQHLDGHPGLRPAGRSRRARSPAAVRLLRRPARTRQRTGTVQVPPGRAADAGVHQCADARSAGRGRRSGAHQPRQRGRRARPAADCVDQPLPDVGDPRDAGAVGGLRRALRPPGAACAGRAPRAWRRRARSPRGSPDHRRLSGRRDAVPARARPPRRHDRGRIADLLRHAAGDRIARHARPWRSRPIRAPASVSMPSNRRSRSGRSAPAS